MPPSPPPPQDTASTRNNDGDWARGARPGAPQPLVRLLDRRPPPSPPTPSGSASSPSPFSTRKKASLDWECVCWKASQIVKHLAYKAPELKDVALLPCSPMMSHDVLPIGFRYRRRCHVKEQDLPGPKTLAKIYLRTKKRLPSSTRSHNLNSDESLQAGLEPQSSGKEDVSGAPISNTMPGTGTHLTKISGTSSLTNAGAPVAPVWQTMFGTVTTCAEVSGIASVTNPGAPAASVPQTVKLTDSAQNIGIAPVTNAGLR